MKNLRLLIFEEFIILSFLASLSPMQLGNDPFSVTNWRYTVACIYFDSIIIHFFARRCENIHT